MKLTRNQFLKTVGYASAASVVGGKAIAATANPEAASLASSAKEMKAAANIKLGVSLYSYQHAIETHDMTLEDCLAELNSIGAESVQIIDGITVANYPNPTEEWVENWFAMLHKYQLTPSLMDTFLDLYNGWRAPEMTMDEQIAQMVRDMKLARRLGFKIIRPTSGGVGEPVGEWLDRIVPYAEELDVKVCPELHSPIPLNGAFVDRIMNTITKTGTKHIGFTLDMGDFDIQTRSQGAGAYGQPQGAPPQGAAAQGARPQGAAPQGAPPAGAAPQGMGGGFNQPPNDPLAIIPILPYIYNMHGKFYDMSDPKTEPTYAKVFKVLVDNGYNGSIDSEYEGQRNLQNQWCTPIQEVFQVRKHHIMMRKLLGRA
jgi:hypothetical protein